MPFYNIKCEKCDYTDSLFKMYSEYEKYMKENICPECGSKLINDFASNLSGVSFVMNMKENTRKMKKASKSLERRRKKNEHARKKKKDPYYDLR